MPSAEDFVNFLFRLPKPAQQVLKIVGLFVLGVGLLLGVVFLLTRPDLTITTELMNSTLSQDQQRWIDYASQAIAKDLQEAELESKNAKTDLDSINRQLNTAKSNKNPQRSDLVSLGHLQTQSEYMSHETKLGERRLKAWKSRMDELPLSPFLKPSTESWTSHDTSNLHLVIVNETNKPLSGIHIVCKGVRRAWRVVLTADYLGLPEAQSWASKFKSEDNFSGPTVLPDLPVLPGGQSAMIDIQGTIDNANLFVSASQAIDADVVPVVRVLDRGLVWVVTRPDKWGYWWGIIILPALILLYMLFQYSRHVYDKGLRKDLLSSNIRYAAKSLIALGDVDSGAKMLVHAAEVGDVSKGEIILDPELEAIRKHDLYYRYFIKDQDYATVMRNDDDGA